MSRNQKKPNHKIKSITSKQDITKTVCMQSNCEFFNQRAVQGVCYDFEGKIIDFAKFAKLEKELSEELIATKKREGRKYVKYLEAMYTCAILNWSGALDETIAARRDIALLRVKLTKLNRTKHKTHSK